MCLAQLLVTRTNCRSIVQFSACPLPYSGKLWGRNFCEFCGFVAMRESFLHEIWCVASFDAAKEVIHESVLQKLYFQKFIPSKVYSLKSFAIGYPTWPFSWKLGKLEVGDAFLSKTTNTSYHQIPIPANCCIFSSWFTPFCYNFLGVAFVLGTVGQLSNCQGIFSGV